MRGGRRRSAQVRIRRRGALGAVPELIGVRDVALDKRMQPAATHTPLNVSTLCRAGRLGTRAEPGRTAS